LKQVDYLIVGCGLAGISFCEELKAHQKTFVVYDDSSQQSSLVAGGLYNPVILKRFTPVWKSKEQIELALLLFKNIEDELNISLHIELPVLRLFNSVEEQNNWFAASDKIGLTDYLSTKIIQNTNTSIKAPFGFGRVLNTGRIDTTKLIENYRKHLKDKSQLLVEAFNYDEINFQEDSVIYKNHQAKHLVFAEGFGIKKNPYFNYLPLKETKGELLIIHAPNLNIDYVLKSSVFIIPLGNHLYTVGATYDWEDKTHKITVKAKDELLKKLKTFITCDFNVVDQIAGIRPTVKDRRPLVGKHPLHKNMFVLNGLGTRGVMIGPYVAKQLFNFIENSKNLEKEIDIKRFSQL
jgi:glycine/D-amino acid oxidase-like deaminating enzyme